MAKASFVPSNENLNLYEIKNRSCSRHLKKSVSDCKFRFFRIIPFSVVNCARRPGNAGVTPARILALQTLIANNHAIRSCSWIYSAPPGIRNGEPARRLMPHTFCRNRQFWSLPRSGCITEPRVGVEQNIHIGKNAAYLGLCYFTASR
jgi:hypothetical protein